jgi:hypothetical protein
VREGTCPSPAASIETCLRQVPHDAEGTWKDSIDKIAIERGYKNRDVINVTKEGLGDSYEAKLKMFFEVRDDMMRMKPWACLCLHFISGAHA